MSTWITSMAHFPKPYQLNNRVPMSIIKTSLQFGSIIKSAVKNEPPAIHSCGGKIEAKIESSTEKILWRCSGCNDNGEISHWQGCGWEDSHLELVTESRSQPRSTRKSKAKKARTATLILNKKELTALAKSIGSEEMDELLANAKALGRNEIALSLTKQQLDDLWALVGDLLDYSPSRQRKMWDEVLNAIGWSLDTLAEDDGSEAHSP